MTKKSDCSADARYAMSGWKITEHNGGRVDASHESDVWRLALPPLERGYANAQIDDYGAPGGAGFRWESGTTLAARARFSAEAGALVGTAGFGFWNAPFGPGTGYRPRLPAAAWFFYASSSSDLPLAPQGIEGNGWFAATIDATGLRALRWAPLALPVLVANQLSAIRRRLWPLVRRDLRISFQPIKADMSQWHEYRLSWRRGGCNFGVDGETLLQTPMSPRGRLGFVSWIDNQYMVATPTGRVRWGTQRVGSEQWLEIAGIRFDPAA